MRSGIYDAVVRHHRRGPPQHSFVYRVCVPLIDLSEVESVCREHPLWSAERPNAVWFRRADFHGTHDKPLALSIADLVDERMGARPAGPILMLGQLRTWGWLFNPITCYWCLDPSGQRTEAFVADVTSTPWHERHAYVAAGAGTDHWFDKALHVSPFMPMNQRYRIAFSEPGERLSVTITSVQHGADVFTASISGQRREISRASLGRLLWRYPLMTVRVSAGIYLQAARLRRKGATFYAHPKSESE